MATATHIDGSMESISTTDVLEQLLDELRDADGEHTDVSVSDDSGWTISAFRDGKVVWENVEEDEGPWHRIGLPRDEILRLFQAVARGDVDVVLDGTWLPGY